MGKVLSQDALKEVRFQLKKAGKKVVFTNGCFDIIHRGHIEYLETARSLGDVLVVAINSDASVRRIKGPTRPIVNEDDRAFVMAALLPVDYVTIFDEDTPYNVIKALVPDVLVKGGDWGTESIVGKDVVEASGGIVRSIQFLSGSSTTAIINKIKETEKNNQ